MLVKGLDQSGQRIYMMEAWACPRGGHTRWMFCCRGGGCPFTQSLQSEWQYLCRCVPGGGVHLEPVEAAIQQVFIPELLAVKSDSVDANF